MFSGKISDTLQDLGVGGFLLAIGGFVGWVWTIDHAVSSNEVKAAEMYVTKEDFVDLRTWLREEFKDIKDTFKEIR